MKIQYSPRYFVKMHIIWLLLQVVNIKKKMLTNLLALVKDELSKKQLKWYFFTQKRLHSTQKRLHSTQQRETKILNWGAQ